MGWVPKGVPPDKSIGAWPSVQEKTAGIENVGKSPCGGTNDEHQSLKVQGNLREHSVVANQEDIPTGERAGQKRTGIGTGMSMKAVTHRVPLGGTCEKSERCETQRRRYPARSTSQWCCNYASPSAV